MYQNAAMLPAFLLIYSAVAGRIERSWISGPIVFVGVGFILGPDALGVLRLNITGEGLRLLAELTLAMVLFTDAANADFGVLRRNRGLPERLLLIGLPLTIVLGFVLAATVFPSLGTLEIALMATMLAPTDAALGKPVVTNRAVPAVMREALKFGERSQRRHLRADRGAIARAGCRNLDRGRDGGPRCSRRDRRDRHRGGNWARVDLAHHLDVALCRGARLDWRTLGGNSDRRAGGGVLCSCAGCGGSGFIACFVGGLLLSGLGASHKKELLRGAEHMGEALALLTWVVFGGIVVARMIDRVTWLAVLYAVLSLTVVRMLPVFLCLIRTRTSTVDKLFIGWFGPRGLATIVFAGSGPRREAAR